VIVSSFNPLALRRFRGILPEVPIGFLYAPDSAAVENLMADLPHEARHPHYSMIEADYMAWAKQHGYRVNTWTVNDPAKAAELYKLRVDGIITDKPDLIREALTG
jgi:glycerophosphoryl diester phosphodiesterase